MRRLRTRLENLVFFLKDSITLTIYAEFLVPPPSGILLWCLFLDDSSLPEVTQICRLEFTDALRLFVRNMETLFMSVAPTRTLMPIWCSASAPTPTPIPTADFVLPVNMALRRSDISVQWPKISNWNLNLSNNDESYMERFFINVI